MSNKLIKLKLTTEKNCFLNIPRSWREEIQQKSWYYFELVNLNNSTKIYLEWSGNYVSNDDYVELAAVFANKLGFIDNQTVLINIIDKEIKKANQIIIQPNSEFDWENFKLYSNEIELNLLNQIKIVWPELVLPIWPKPEICIFIKIHFKESNQQLLRLETFTELIAITDERDIKKLQLDQMNLDNNKLSTTQNESTLSSFFKFLPQLKLNNQTKQLIKSEEQSTSELFILPTLIDNKTTILNVINLNNDQLNLDKINTVYINSNRFNAKNKDRSIGKLIRLLSPFEINQRKETLNKRINDKNKFDLKEENQLLETIVEINFIDQCPFDCLIPCNSLALQLNLNSFTKVLIKSINQIESSSNNNLIMNNQKFDNLNKQIDETNLINISIANCISLSCYQTIINQDQIRSLIYKFIKDYCLENGFLILNKLSLIKLQNYEFTFEPEFNQNEFIVLTEQSINQNLEIRILNQLKIRLKTSWNLQELPLNNLDKLKNKNLLINDNLIEQQNNSIYKSKNYQFILDRCSTLINECFNDNNQLDKINKLNSKIVLLHGKLGSGKTTLINNLIDEFNIKNKKCNIINLDCSKLKGKKIDLFKKTLLNSINESIYNQPSLLIIENLHILLPKNTNIEQIHKLDLLYNDKIKLILIELIENYLKETNFVYGTKLFTLITSRTDELFEADQNLELDIFDEILELRSPSSYDCSLKFINHLINFKLKNYQINYDKIDFNDLTNLLSTELNDCVSLDLDLISDKIINKIMLNKDNNSNKLEIKLANYLEAFKNYVPINLRNLKSKNLKNQNKKLDDLGGLNDVKEKLKQIIYWPIKYPKLFQNYPIQPQTNILLYGIPGTGKTCLAEALANEFKINFISVKGPEILSKYIGASEQAIRDLFEKANLSRPCLIFFDEFDSIVPPRQNNNTDVTDRIVNQILTQMDGIESLKEGIYIVAATSRPDMIDPALLRPGRFDVCLECNLPSLEERYEILKLLSKQIKLDDDVELNKIAEKTINFTGSDLNTLIINATNESINELICLDDNLEVKNDDQLKENLVNLKLNSRHFDLALNSTSPSFNDEEIKEFDRIFAKLRSDDSFDKKPINLETKSIFAF